MYLFISFLFLRFSDIFSTYKCLASDCSVESNPFMNYVVQSYGLNAFVYVNIFLSLLILLVFYLTRKNRISKAVLVGFLFINLFVVILNLYPQILF